MFLLRLHKLFSSAATPTVAFGLRFYSKHGKNSSKHSYPTPKREHRERTFQRRSLLMELENPSTFPAPAHRQRQQEGAKLQSSNSSDSAYMLPSMYSRTLAQHTAHLPSSHHHAARYDELRGAANSNSNSNSVYEGSSNSLEEDRQQRAVLREMFSPEQNINGTFLLRKDAQLIRKEVEAFKQSHKGKSPKQYNKLYKNKNNSLTSGYDGGSLSKEKVESHTDVPLAPVAALKLYSSTLRSDRSSALHEQVKQSILLQKHVATSKLMQSNEQHLFRCLSCFSVFSARPREALSSSDDNNHNNSFQKEEQERNSKIEEKLSRDPRLRKKIFTRGYVGLQNKRFRGSKTRIETATAGSRGRCPNCKSNKIQWALEYVHQRTHCH